MFGHELGVGQDLCFGDGGAETVPAVPAHRWAGEVSGGTPGRWRGGGHVVSWAASVGAGIPFGSPVDPKERAWGAWASVSRTRRPRPPTVAHSRSQPAGGS